MSTDTWTFLLKLISAAVYEMGIPVDGKRAFERSLRRNMKEAQKKYINNHAAYGVLDEEWFHQYLRHCMPIQGVCRYILEEESWKWARQIYIRNLASYVRDYAEVWADGISDLEEMALRNFYRMLIVVLREMIKPLKRGYLLPLTYDTVYGLWEEDLLSEPCGERQIAREMPEVLMAIRGHEPAERAAALLEQIGEDDGASWLEKAVSGFCSPSDEEWQLSEVIYRRAAEVRAESLAELLRQYFRRTGTLYQVLLREIGRMEAGEKTWWVLRSLIDEDVEKSLGEAYRDQKLEDGQVRCCLKALITSRIYQQYWTGDVSDADPYYHALVELYKERVRLRQWNYEWVDYEVMMADGEIAYLAALTDRDRYVSLIEELLDKGGRDDWTRIEFWDYPREILNRRLDLRAVARDFYLNRDDMSMRRWMACLTGTQWEHYASFYIYHWLTRYHRNRVPAGMERWIRKYYDRQLESLDFRKAVIWKTDSSMCYCGMVAEIITMFAERFGYDMPKEKAKDLLFWSAYMGRGQKNWLPAKYLTEEEIREQVIVNVMSGELKGDVMRWHIRYCIDYQIRECAPVILKAAKNPVRNVWVRRDALRYACGMMGVHEVCEHLLPGLKGELFFFVAEYFRDTKDRELADIIWNYGEEYPSQKLRSDICLTLMQDRRGVESLSRHLQRRNGLPMEPFLPGPAEAVRGIRDPELTDELEKLLKAAWKTGFRDDPGDSLLAAAAAALVKIAHSGDDAYGQVMQIFERLMEKYRDEEEKLSALRRWRRECERE